MPFKQGSIVQIAERICKCDYDTIPNFIPKEIHEIIKKCFVINPKARPSVFEILQN